MADDQNGHSGIEQAGSIVHVEMYDGSVRTMTATEWDAWRKTQEWYPCTHCGGDGEGDFYGYPDRCHACNGTGDGRRQTVW